MKDQPLRDHGLKVTGPRLKILHILQEHEQRHWSAEEIFSKLSEEKQAVGLATVYRVLTQFEQAGLVKRHVFEGGYSVYEWEEGEHHDHIVCVKCNQVNEFVDDVIEDRQQRIATKMGYELTDHRLVIYGVCPTCRAC